MGFNSECCFCAVASSIVKGNRMGGSMSFGNQRSSEGSLDILRQVVVVPLPREISAQELMKCQNDLPSVTA